MPPKSKLKAVAPTAAKPSRPKILIYGKPGTGKTYNSLNFPSCYYIDTEGGANLEHYTNRLAASGGVYLGPENGSNDFDVVLDQVQALVTEPHPYRTLVIDSISHLFGTEVANEQERMAKENRKDEWGASRKGATGYMRRIVNWLDRLDMNVILIAHHKDEYGLVRGKREVVGSTFDGPEKIEYILHLALHITKEGASRKARVRKSRILEFQTDGVGSSFEWSYDEFADRYGREVIEAGVKVITLATKEQLAETERLMKIVRMPDDWFEKCLKRGKSETINDMEADHVAAMITMLNQRATDTTIGA